MKKTVTFSALALSLVASMGLSAQTGNVVIPSKVVGKVVTIKSSGAIEKADSKIAKKNKVAPIFDPEVEDQAFYPAPAGVFYLGFDMDSDKPVNEAAVAPCGVDITFHCPLSTNSNDYEWTYTNPEGKEVEVENEDIVMNVSELDLVDAPLLYAQGRWGRGTYSMAREGIIFGQGYYASRGNEWYASNQNTNFIMSEFIPDAATYANYEDAGSELEKQYPVKISDVTVKGFGELFSYVAPYSFDALRASIVVAGDQIAMGDVVADIYPFSEETGVDFGKKLATYEMSTGVQNDKYQGSYWYTLEFAPAEGSEAPVITTPVMVVFHPAEGCEKVMAPNVNPYTEALDGEPATSFLYAAYTRNGETYENGCLNYAGVELEGNRGSQYLYHWTVSGKMNYDVTVPVATFAVTATYDNTQGSVSINGSEGSDDVEEGSDAVIVITPEDGYQIAKVTLDGNDITDEVGASGQYVVNDVTSAHEIVVVFELKQFSLSIALQGGVITSKYDYGTVIKYIPEADDNWTFHSATVGTEVITTLDEDGAFVVGPLTEDTTVSVVFKEPVSGVASVEADAITVTVQGNTVMIVGAPEDANVEVFDAAGVRCYAGSDHQVNLGKKGVYIVSVAGQSYKVLLR